MFRNRVCQKLYEEHAAVQALLQRVEQAISRNRDDVPDAKDATLAKLMNDLVTELPGEVDRHFDFEEAELFSFLAEEGIAGIGAHLTYEHNIIRPIGAALVNLIRQVREKGLNAERWADFRNLGQQLSMTLGPHAHKEDMALLPMLEDAMDEAKEAELYEKYVLEHV